MDKIFNTLRMMGVSSYDALTFSDDIKIYHLSIDSELKQTILDRMLGTIIMGKSIKEWWIKFQKQLAKEDRTTIWEHNVIQIVQIKAVLELILQEYYREVVMNPGQDNFPIE